MKEEIHYSIQVPLSAHKNERNGKVPLVVWHFQLKNETTATEEEASNVNFEMSLETLQSLMETLNRIQNRIDFLQQR